MVLFRPIWTVGRVDVRIVLPVQSVVVRSALVAVQAQDSEIRGVVASAVLALDDVVDVWPKNRRLPA
jgi:hypothetical protein